MNNFGQTALSSGRIGLSWRSSPRLSIIENNPALLRAILSTVARQTFPEDRLAEVVAKSGGDKQVRAYNMCDGTVGQGQIAKALKLDAGNFSRTVSRWIEAGIVFRLGEGREAKLLHAYPLSGIPTKKRGAK